jgi:hypothetical protein
MHKRILAALVVLASINAFAGQRSSLKVLPGISQGRLTVFPIVSDYSHDTSDFITLDQGLKSGKVTVTEGGRLQGLRRGRRPRPVGDEVNRLWLVNDSDRPLLLLAGEIVVGGKQDRVVAKDRIVPPHGDPVDLSVFCVEPGRWTEKTAAFNSLGSQMAQPTVRAEAMARKDQQKVWDAVGNANRETASAAQTIEVLSETSSYATVNENKAVKRKMAEISDPIERSYDKVIKNLKDKNAVGVAVAVNGRMVWADVFASPQLLQEYWPKLIRSYVAEVVGQPAQNVSADQKVAQAFIDLLQGRHETAETEPGVFRQSEGKGDGYRVFTLTSLLPKTGFDVHIAKMSEDFTISQAIE